MNNISAIELVAFIISIFSLGGALWRAYEGIGSLKEQIKDVRHQLEITEIRLNSMDDKVILSVQGTKELAEHLRSRTKADHERVSARVGDLESFLAKTANFERRSQSEIR